MTMITLLEITTGMASILCCQAIAVEHKLFKDIIVSGY